MRDSVGVTPPNKAVLRTKVQNWVRRNRRQFTIQELGEQLMQDGVVSESEIRDLFGLRGFHEFLRRVGGETDVLTGKPVMCKVGSDAEQGVLWKSYGFAKLDEKLYHFRDNLKSIRGDAKKLRNDWNRIYDEHRAELDNPGGFRPPSWLFDVADMDDDEGASAARR